MATLDEANTSTYGQPELTEVNLGVGTNPGILISGHDLKDMEELLKQTEGSGVDVYTHGEMLPISFDIGWYEQKAVAVLLALLHLGAKGIRLGPTLPAFLSPTVAKVLVENFDIKPTGDVQADVDAMMAAA